MFAMLRRFIAPLAAVSLAIFAVSHATAGGNQKSDKTEKAPTDKAVEKGDKKTDKGEKPRIFNKFEPPNINIGQPNWFFGGKFGKSEKFPDISLQIPSVQKLKDAEEAYRKARDGALLDIDLAIEKAETDLAKAHKDAKDKDADTRAKAHAESAKLSQDIHNLKSARSRASSPHLPAPLPQESRLAAKLDQISDLVAIQLKLEKGQGLVVVGVEKDGAADKAGLKANDILVAIDGKPVTSEMKDLRRMLARIQPDTKVAVTVFRAGAREQIADLKLPALSSK